MTNKRNKGETKNLPKTFWLKCKINKKMIVNALPVKDFCRYSFIQCILVDVLFRCCRFNVSFYLHSFLFYFSPAFDFWCCFLINFFFLLLSSQANKQWKKGERMWSGLLRVESLFDYSLIRTFFFFVDVVAAVFFFLSRIYFALVKFKNVISIFLCEIVFRCSVSVFFRSLCSLFVPLRLCWMRLLGILSVSFVFPERFRPLCSSNSPKKKKKKT